VKGKIKMKKLVNKLTPDKNKQLDVDEFKHAKRGIRKQIQKFGSFMAGMIMPVVSILIA
jgi:PTS system mannitol-specific IIC component